MATNCINRHLGQVWLVAVGPEQSRTAILKNDMRNILLAKHMNVEFGFDAYLLHETFHEHLVENNK
jgi:hypothetical protein